MRRLSRFLSLLAALALLSVGCYPHNTALLKIDKQAGYRYSVVRNTPSSEQPFVILGFSGGGTRAAAFAFGLMEGLRGVEYTARDGSKRKLLDDVEIISSVSGGSFASSYYALFPDSYFEDFPHRFLYPNIEGGLIVRAFNPYNWIRFISPSFSRIDMADEYYNQAIFRGKTFADLIATPRGKVPFLVLNATDISIAHRFEFTQDQFDLLCSDLSGMTVSRAVAASSNFPLAFAPLTVDIHHKKYCEPLPEWVNNALGEYTYPYRRYYDARAAASYHDPDRNYVHLLDGGISDNLGLRGPYQAVTTNDTGWSVLTLINKLSIQRVIMISTNAKTTKHRDWDKSKSPPGPLSVLNMVATSPMDDVTLDSVEMTADYVHDMEQLSDTVDTCDKKLGESCPQASPLPNPIVTRYDFVELSFDQMPDERLRRCLEGLPTNFHLPRETVDLLRSSAIRLLMTSGPFLRAMHEIDPTWTPKEAPIDQNLILAVCGPG
jgi:predicted acylesterase/phospholipase RssA